MKMKLFAIAAGLTLLSSCMPQVYSLYLDVKYPSQSGLDLSGKSIGVVCLDNGSAADSSFVASFSDGLAQGLEAIFDTGYHVDVYSLPKVEGGDYSCKDSVVMMLMALGTDAVFVVDSPRYDEPEGGKLPCHENVYVFDSKDKSDSVVHLRRVARIPCSDSSEVMSYSDAQYFGYGVTEAVKLSWKNEYMPLYYFDDLNNSWIEALSCVEQMQWQKALDIWLSMVGNSSYEKRSCVFYNIATACYLMDNFDIALQWLDKSDSLKKLPYSAILRERIIKRRP